jgi:hypothetical protein
MKHLLGDKGLGVEVIKSGVQLSSLGFFGVGSSLSSFCVTVICEFS